MTLQKDQNFQGLAQEVVNTALQFSDNNALFINDTFYTYRHLLEIAHSIYMQIPKDITYKRIGIYCNDDVYSYASILAVNLHGAAYVPLNKSFPIIRNRKIIQECELELILTSIENDEITHIAGDAEVKNISQTHMTLSDDDFKIKMNDLINGKHNDDLICYILFTSGSTGVPKGVPVTNENIKNFFNYFLNKYDFNEHDSFLQVYELTFDVSVFSFFMPLLVGACCYVLPDEGIRPMKIIEYLKKYNITVVSMVPTVLRYFEKYLEEITLPNLRYSFFSGDALFHDLALKWKSSIPNAVIHNFYGPTETTIVCTRYIFNEISSTKESVNRIVPLGVAFEGMDFLIVDENNQSAEKGELCFFGTQVISAYLNNSNEEHFFIYKGKRYYKTGDIASVNKSGNLVFHGRTDSQVKINGYRVELTEIENAIFEITKANCVVICKKDENMTNQLYAFIKKNKIDENILREELYSVLPTYMIPNTFIAVEKFNLTINGKVDKIALINSYL